MFKLLIFGLLGLQIIRADPNVIENKCNVDTSAHNDTTIYCRYLQLGEKELPLDGPIPPSTIVHLNILRCTGSIDENSFPKLRGELTSMNIEASNLEKFILPPIPKLTYIGIKKSKIPTLNGAFKNVKSLESISIRKGKFEIKEGDLDGLDKLDTFESYKVKVQLTNRLLRDLRKLKELSVNTALIEKIPSDAFQNNPDILSLDLEGNDIKTIEPGTFDNLQNLHRIDMTSTDIQTFDVNLTKNLKNLQTLGIPARSVKGLDLIKLFENCPKLQAFAIKNKDASCPEVKELLDRINFEKTGRFMAIVYSNVDGKRSC